MLVAVLCLVAMVTGVQPVDVQKLSADLIQLQAKLSATQAQVDSLTYIVNRRVAFWVQMAPDTDNTVPAPADGPFKFTLVQLNDGNAYDPATGVFTAPHSGVYSLALQIFLRGPQYALIDIKVNGRIVSRCGLDTRGPVRSPDTSQSTSVLVRLTAGDRVWVESGTGKHMIVSDVHTYFTGHLLYSERCV